MKKTLLTILCALTTLCGMAQTETNYNEQYVVTVNGSSSDAKDGQQAIVDNGDGTVNFVLKSLDIQVSYMGQQQTIQAGDVCLKNLAANVEADGLLHFEGSDMFDIPQDGLSDILKMAVSMGFLEITNIPLKIEGKCSDTKLYALLNINMSKPSTAIIAEIGTDNFPVAKIYSEQLLVTINGEASEPQATNVTVVDNGNGTINFVLKNFFLGAGDETMPVGNIVVENVAVTEGEDGLKHISYDGNVAIQPGDEEGVEWVGPMFGPIPLNLQGKMNDEKLYVTIDIDLVAFGQKVHVQLGTDDFVAPEPVGTVYNEQLLVTVNGEASEPQEASVTVYDNGNGTINFVLKNFYLGAGDETMPVGNIVVENVAVKEGEDGLKYISYEGNVAIQPGDMEGVEMWMGTMFGEIPLNLQGKMNDEKLYVTIDIDLADFGQTVHVELGTDDFFPEPAVKKSYTEPYYVTAYGATPEVERTTKVNIYENSNGTIDFELEDFELVVQQLTIPFGTLTLHELEAWEGKNGKRLFGGERTIVIPEDQMPDALKALTLMGLKNEFPLKINEGWYDDEHLYVVFDTKATMSGIGEFSAQVQVGHFMGDLNGDNKADISDAISVLNIMASGEYKTVADLNGDGKVDIADFVAVLNIMAAQ